ncbi:hypothetical protein Hanom_Chr16g01485021 [Helianthus anomalus]
MCRVAFKQETCCGTTTMQACMRLLENPGNRMIGLSRVMCHRKNQELGKMP